MSLFVSILIITILWGVGNVFVKKGLNYLTPWQAYAIDSVMIAFPLWMTYGIINGGNLLTITPLAVITALIVSIVYGIYYYATSLGEVSLTSAVIASSPIITLFLAYYFLHERLELISYLGIAMTMIGIILISLPKNYKIKNLGRWVIPSLIVLIGYGVDGYLSKMTLFQVTNATYLMLLAIGQLFVVGIWRLFRKDKFPSIQKKSLRVPFIFSFIGIVFFNLGQIAYFYSLERGFASIIVPLSSTYILVTLIMSILWLKEKINLRQIIGIFIVLIGVIIVSLKLF